MNASQCSFRYSFIIYKWQLYRHPVINTTRIAVEKAALFLQSGLASIRIRDENGAFQKTLHILEEFENASFVVNGDCYAFKFLSFVVWTENISSISA